VPLAKMRRQRLWWFPLARVGPDPEEDESLEEADSMEEPDSLEELGLLAQAEVGQGARSW